MGFVVSVIGVIIAFLAWQYPKVPQTPASELVQVLDFDLNIDELELEYGEQFQLQLESVYPTNAPYEEINVTFEKDFLISIDGFGLITASEYSSSKQAASTNMIVTVGGATRRIPVKINNSYATNWSMELPAFVDRNGGTWTSYDLVFAKPVPNCTGFTLQWTITETDLNAFGKNWRVFARSQDRWEYVGDIFIQELNKEASAQISFADRTIYGVAVYPPSGYYGTFTHEGEIKSLQYTK